MAGGERKAPPPGEREHISSSASAAASAASAASAAASAALTDAAAALAASFAAAVAAVAAAFPGDTHEAVCWCRCEGLGDLATSFGAAFSSLVLEYVSSPLALGGFRLLLKAR